MFKTEHVLLPTSIHTLVPASAHCVHTMAAANKLMILSTRVHISNKYRLIWTYFYITIITGVVFKLGHLPQMFSFAHVK